MTLRSGLLLLALLAPVVAQETPISGGTRGGAASSDVLEALDEVSASVVERAGRSVVLIEVERMALAPRSLTFQERTELGVIGEYDRRYFSRPEGPCSGVAIGQDLVVTTCWNVEGDGAVTVIAPDGRRIPALRLGREENLDAALLVAPGLGLSPIQVAPESPVVGKFVFLVGRGPDQKLTCAQGIVSGLGRYQGDAFAHSARTSYELAGGAIVDLEGRLLGFSIRHGDRVRQGQASGVGFGAPLGRLGSALPTMARGQVIPRRQVPFMGIEIDRRPGVEGVRIARLLPGGAAEKAGIKVGDVVKIFNQAEIKSLPDLQEELRSLSVGKKIVVTVLRGTETLDIEVQLGGREAAE